MKHINNTQLYRQADLILVPKNKAYLRQFEIRIREIIRYLLIERGVRIIENGIDNNFVRVRIKFEQGQNISKIVNDVRELSSDFLCFSLPELNNQSFWAESRLISITNEMAPRCLVIGGAGYIGSHVTKELIKAGYTPVVFDNLSTGLRENLFNGVEFINGDIRNENEIKSAMKDIDAVIYLAALKAAGESMNNPQKYAANNICGAINVLNAMCDFNINKIIFSSSAAVYGEPRYLPVDENHPTEPINFYGFTKLKMERLLKWYDQLKGIKYFSLRYFNAVGYDPNGEIKGLEQKPTNLLPVLMEAAKGLRPYVEVFGDDYKTADGSCIRDYIHVSDLATAHVAVLNKLFSGYESMTLNLGASSGISVFEMINEVKKVSGVDFKINIVPRRPGDPEKLLADSKMAYENLGWKPQYSDLETIVKTTWQAYKNN